MSKKPIKIKGKQKIYCENHDCKYYTEESHPTAPTMMLGICSRESITINYHRKCGYL